MVERNGKLDVAEKNAEHITALGMIAGIRKAADFCESNRCSYHDWNGDLALLDVANRLRALISEVAEGKMPDA